MGIPAYNKECRSIVTRYTKEWETTVKRVGRWIDFDNDYKTLEPWYMESVWWVFKTIFDKGLVYRGYKVVPFSTGCNTGISNFEANLNYKDTIDPAVVVAFPLSEDPEVSFLAWTTTPWTLPSNLGLCVHPELEYVKIKDIKRGNKLFILGKSRLISLFPKINAGKKKFKQEENFEILQEYKGADLAGKTYVPLFPYFKDHPGAFKVMVDTYVTDDSGTGIVHQAPAFGEDDYRVCIKNGVVEKGAEVPCPIDPNGRFTSPVEEFKGVYIKDADKDICKMLKASGRLIDLANLKHSYPFCYRSDTPLIYKAIPQWFVNVEAVKDKLVKNNAQTYWVPAFVKEKRFHNWLCDARDWAIGRSRFWGTPLPVWTNEDFTEIVCVGSIEDLAARSGITVTDLHRESIDDITIPSEKNPSGPPLKRIDEVFDCWFESGSMPYAQQHYPFENKEKFTNGFPADFIAEGLDQTRGWFYTLTVLSTILFDKPAFKNLVVNGLVLAEDGKKMSKSLKNYPDPVVVIDKYGADALRLYLINSPVVRAEPLKFSEGGVFNVVKGVFTPWFNVYRFLAQGIKRLELEHGKFSPDRALAKSSPNVMDAWIQASLQGLIQFVRQEMAAYRLYTVVPKLIGFIDELTNWYVRLNRSRLKDTENPVDCATALSTLYFVLLSMTQLMAPLCPFFTEFQYKNLRKIHPDAANEGVAIDALGRAESVHYTMIPEPDMDLVDPVKEQRMQCLQTVLELGRKIRERKNLSLKQPVREMLVVSTDNAVHEGLSLLKNYILEEFNVMELTLSREEDKWATMSVAPNQKVLGKRLGKDFKKVKKAIPNLSKEQVLQFMSTGELEVEGCLLAGEDLMINREFKGDKASYEADTAPDNSLLVIVDIREDDELRAKFTARELINRVQKLRKSSGCQVGDLIAAYFESDGTALVDAIKDNVPMLFKAMKLVPLPMSLKPADVIVLGHEDTEINGVKVAVEVCKPSLHFAPDEELLKVCGGADITLVKKFLAGMDYAKLSTQTDDLAFALDGKEVKLKLGAHYFATYGDKQKAYPDSVFAWASM